MLPFNLFELRCAGKRPARVRGPSADPVKLEAPVPLPPRSVGLRVCSIDSASEDEARPVGEGQGW